MLTIGFELHNGPTELLKMYSVIIEVAQRRDKGAVLLTPEKSLPFVKRPICYDLNGWITTGGFRLRRVDTQNESFKNIGCLSS